MKKSKERSKIVDIGIDILGILLILASVLFGWLPGVGGIPLFLAGLGLLASNHKWARDLLRQVKDKGTTLVNTIFKEHPVLVVVYDICAIILLLLAGLIFFGSDGNIIRASASIVLFAGIGIFIGNRQRIYKINAFVRKVTKRN